MPDRHALAHEPPPSSDWLDQHDVPAAVLCAVCGQADCEGCVPLDSVASGVIAIIPWERPGAGVLSRLWATASACTQGAESFSAALPRGAVAPALRFAVLAEALATVSMVGTLLAIVALLLPGLVMSVVLDPALRAGVIEWLALGLPALTAWMVAVHVGHALAVDRGAAGLGAPRMPRRAVRFGLYACGWDLMTSPLGAVVTLLAQGPRAALGLAGLSMTVPSRATVALLRGVYGLDAASAQRAHRRGIAAAAVLVVSTATALLAIALLW